MKAFIPAAGLGTRLKPWTEHHPKALFPIDGIPMLEIVYNRLKTAGIEDITLNVHHFPDQIKKFILGKGWEIKISDESAELLETGGALLKARDILCENDEPILIHNVDILSNADITALETLHKTEGNEVTLLVSERNSSRRLIFDENWMLRGWHSIINEEYKPRDFKPACTDKEVAFSGIYIINPSVILNMVSEGWKGKFSIMDYLIASIGRKKIGGAFQLNLSVTDIGKNPKN